MTAKIRNAALNLFGNEPALYVPTDVGDFILTYTGTIAFNIDFFKVDWRKYVSAATVKERTLVHKAAEDYAAERYIPCEKFEQIKHGRIVRWKDTKTGLIVPQGALLAVAGRVEYLAGPQNTLLIQSAEVHAQLVAIAACEGGIL